MKTDWVWTKEHTRLMGRAAAWNTLQRKGGLLRGGELKKSEDWLQRHPPKTPPPNPDVVDFIHASRKAARKRLGYWLAGAVAGIAVLAGISWVAMEQNNRRAANVLAVKAKTEGDPGKAHAHARNAYILSTSSTVYETLLETYHGDAFSRIIEEHAPETIQFTPDGQRFLLFSTQLEGFASIWRRDGTKIADLELKENANQMMISPGGDYLLSTQYKTEGENNISSFTIWNLDGTERLTFEGHPGVIWSMAIAPDGDTIASWTKGDTLRLWNLEGKELIAFDPAKLAYDISRLGFNSDGTLLVTGSWDETAHVWDLQGNHVAGIDREDSTNRFAAFVPGKNRVLSGNAEGLVRIWDLQGNIHNSAKLENALKQATFSGEGSRVLMLTAFGEAYSWDLSPVEEDWEQPPPPVRLGGACGSNKTTFSYLAFTGADNLILSVTTDGVVQRWEPNGEPNSHVGAIGKEVEHAALSPDGRILLTEDRTDGWFVRYWDLGARGVGVLGHPGIVQKALFVPGTDWLLSCDHDGILRTWGNDGQLRASHGDTGYCANLTVARGGRFAWSVEDSNRSGWGYNHLYVADAKNRPERWREYEDLILDLAFSPGGHHLAVATQSQVEIIDGEGDRVSTYAKEGFQAEAITWADLETLWIGLSQDDEGLLVALDPKGNVLLTQPVPWVDFLRTSPDGRHLLSSHRREEKGEQRYEARVWTLARTGDNQPRIGPLATLGPLDDWITSARFSPGGTRIIIGSRTGEAQLWNIGGKKLAELPHGTKVSAVAFVSGGIITGTDKSQLFQWEPRGFLFWKQWEPTIQLRGHTKAITSVESQGSLLLSASEDGTARL